MKSNLRNVKSKCEEKLFARHLSTNLYYTWDCTVYTRLLATPPPPPPHPVPNWCTARSHGFFDKGEPSGLGVQHRTRKGDGTHSEHGRGQYHRRVGVRTGKLFVDLLPAFCFFFCPAFRRCVALAQRKIFTVSMTCRGTAVLVCIGRRARLGVMARD